jgi:hypothetical protein
VGGPVHNSVALHVQHQVGCHHCTGECAQPHTFPASPCDTSTVPSYRVWQQGVLWVTCCSQHGCHIC